MSTWMRQTGWSRALSAILERGDFANWDSRTWAATGSFALPSFMRGWD
jgi:hypothetical protein